ncbi:MAG: DNA mismatch repair protein MutS [Spirochaetes bacterium]|nr:DNA mismatch repair protein MutS [Spirochaetota bacterium]
MSFHSILFRKPGYSINMETLKEPPFFTDLNLDQVISTITADKEEYNLKSFFYTPLSDIGTIKYRQEIFRDFNNKTLLENIKSFAEKMSTMRRYIALADKLEYKYHKEGWFLEALNIYCDAVNDLVHDLSAANLESKGFLSFREYIIKYAGSGAFTSLMAETKTLKSYLATVKYCVLIKSNGGRVRKYESEIDYSAEVEKTFEKFKQGAVKDYTVKLPGSTGMNHVEAKILELVARLYPDIFSNLDDYYLKMSDYPDEKIAVFDREVQFYISYLEYISILKQAGLRYCYPEISAADKMIYADETFDCALGYKLVMKSSPVVCNDFYLKNNERIIVVSGPNQGGKTTFARTFGQLHYLAGIGCPVPGREARLCLFDRIFTHFEKEENIKNLRGKLQDDLVRIYDILSKATSHSIIIMNEIFTSTTLKDGIFLSRKIIKKIMQLDLLCVLVTFMDELSVLSEKTVSMVSTVVPENPALRTYKIVRKPADGLAYALSIAEKYRLTYDSLTERIKS